MSLDRARVKPGDSSLGVARSRRLCLTLFAERVMGHECFSREQNGKRQGTAALQNASGRRKPFLNPKVLECGRLLRLSFFTPLPLAASGSENSGSAPWTSDFGFRILGSRFSPLNLWNAS